MEFKQEDIKLNVIQVNCKGLGTTENRDRFVKVEHIPSGITVTEWSQSQPKARDLAMFKLEQLFNLWNSSI